MRKKAAKPQSQMALPHTPRTLSKVVELVWEDKTTGRDIQSLAVAVKGTATWAESLLWADQNLKAGIRSVLRQKSGKHGLPRAVSLRGEYRDTEQLPLFSDFVEWAYGMARRGHEMYEMARKVATYCYEKTGRPLDAEVVIHGAENDESFEEVLAKVSAA